MDTETEELRAIRMRIEAHLRRVYGVERLPSREMRAGKSHQPAIAASHRERSEAGDKDTCSDCAWGYDCARSGVCQRRAEGAVRSRDGRGSAA